MKDNNTNNRSLFDKLFIEWTDKKIVMLAITSIICGCTTFTSANHSSKKEDTIEYFVSLDGNDSAPGTAKEPFRTISRAANAAQPGDTITVREGIYREWISPPRGGSRETKRITYRAAPGEDVRIMGSEPASGWTDKSDGVWQLVLPTKFFGQFNPFTILTRNPKYIEADEEGDGWGWLKYGRWTHLGDVYINGQGLIEKKTLDEVIKTPLSWFTETKDDKTYIQANFGKYKPNQEAVEINKRPHAFFPETPGINYITIQGFTIMNVASHWAPPEAFQPGAVGSNGGHHWRIEDNIIAYAKSVCISIGNPNKNLNITKQSGHHTISGNIILRCGQAGIAGQAWVNHSTITKNIIEGINYRKEFGGWETAGIKHHNSRFLKIENNLVRHIHTIDPDIGAAHGIWLDFDNRNAIVQNNIIIDTEANALLSEANIAGPNLYANNIIIGGNTATASSLRDIWAHNLFYHTEIIWNNQDWGNRPAIAHSRWFSNVFISDSSPEPFEGRDLQFKNNVRIGKIDKNSESKIINVQISVGEYKLEAKSTLLALHINAPSKLLAHKVPILDSEQLNLEVEFDASVSSDFFGHLRQSNTNMAGPFATLSQGPQLIQLFVLPQRYSQARTLIGASLSP